eukprot:gene1161-685_t
MCICEERHYLLTDQPSRGKAFVFLHVTWWFGNRLTSLSLSLSLSLSSCQDFTSVSLYIYIYIYICLFFEARIELHQPSKTVGSITLQSLSPLLFHIILFLFFVIFHISLCRFFFFFFFFFFCFFFSTFFLYLFSLPPYLLNRLRLPLMDPLLLPLRSPGGGALATVVHSESTSSGNDETQTQTPTPISGIGIPSHAHSPRPSSHAISAPPAVDTAISVLWAQLLALLQRTVRQKRRRPLTTLWETLIPVVFAVVLLGLSRGFMNFVPATDYVLAEENIQSTTFQDYFCFNDTATPIAGLDLCSARQPPPRPSISAIDAQTSNDNEDATISCLSQEETARRSIPVNGLCSFYGRDGFHLYLHRVINAAGGHPVALSTLDGLIAAQWAARVVLGGTALSTNPPLAQVVAGMGIGSGQDSEYSAIQNSGMLYFAPREHVPDALIAFLNESSSFFRYVYGGVFDTVEDARQHVQDGTEPAWAILTVGDFSKGFTVDIALAQTSLPRTPVALYPDFTGAFQHNTANLYLLSGFVYLQKILYDYYIYQLREAKQLLSEYQPFNSSFYRLSYLASDKQRRKDEDGEELERPTTTSTYPVVFHFNSPDTHQNRAVSEAGPMMSFVAAPAALELVLSLVSPTAVALLYTDFVQFGMGGGFDWDSFSFVYLTPKPMAYIIFLSADEDRDVRHAEVDTTMVDGGDGCSAGSSGSGKEAIGCAAERDGLKMVWYAWKAPSPLGQFMAMLKKKWWSAIRDRRLLVLQVLCPVIAAGVAMLLQLIKAPETTYFTYALSMYKERTTLPVAEDCLSLLGSAEEWDQTVPGVQHTAVNSEDFFGMEAYVASTYFTHALKRFSAIQCGNGTTWGDGSKLYGLFYNSSSTPSVVLTVAQFFHQVVMTGLMNAGASVEFASRVPFELSSSLLPSNPYSQPPITNLVAGDPAWALGLRYLFRLFPSFAVGDVFMSLAYLDIGFKPGSTPWSMDVVGWPCVYMACEIPICIALLCALEHPKRDQFIRRAQTFFIRCCCPSLSWPTSDPEDDAYLPGMHAEAEGRGGTPRVRRTPPFYSPCHGYPRQSSSSSSGGPPPGSGASLDGSQHRPLHRRESKLGSDTVVSHRRLAYYRRHVALVADDRNPGAAPPLPLPWDWDPQQRAHEEGGAAAEPIPYSIQSRHPHDRRGPRSPTARTLSLVGHAFSFSSSSSHPVADTPCRSRYGSTGRLRSVFVDSPLHTPSLPSRQFQRAQGRCTRHPASSTATHATQSNPVVQDNRALSDFHSGSAPHPQLSSLRRDPFHPSVSPPCSGAVCSHPHVASAFQQPSHTICRSILSLQDLPELQRYPSPHSQRPNAPAKAPQQFLFNLHSRTMSIEPNTTATDPSSDPPQHQPINPPATPPLGSSHHARLASFGTSRLSPHHSRGLTQSHFYSHRHEESVSGSIGRTPALRLK